MKTFRHYISEITESLENHPVLHNFLHHISSPLMHKTRSGKQPKEELEEAHALDHIRGEGVKNAKEGNPFHHMKTGFHAAFPEGEHPKETAKKATESQNHFHKFMHERGGHSKDNKMKLFGQNMKTRTSAGEGVKTIGISMAPHHTSGYKHDLCPKASKECRKNCLGLTAGGNKQFPEAAMRAKILRTQYVHEHPEHAARLISHEIGHNEKAAKKINHKSGVRLNVTSDIPYEHLMPKKFFDKHKDTHFYDYTKIAGRLHNKNKPSNYHLALSHTGTGHDESNDKDAIHALNHGHVVAMVHHRGKHTTPATHVEDVQTGKRWKVANGDKDDNIFDRHKQAGVDHHEGVVSGLKLKGVKNAAAGHFANKVDPDGIIRINHPKKHDEPHHDSYFPILK